MSGLWTVLGICFAISFALQSTFHFLLLLTVAAVYVWFFNPVLKSKFKSFLKSPVRKLKSWKIQRDVDKAKKFVEKKQNQWNK